MRFATCLSVAILAFVGCEPIDTSRSGSVSDPTTRTNDAAPASTTPSSPSSTDATVPATTTPSTAPGSSTSDTQATPPDNTAVNKRDASGATKTAIDQKETQGDVNITANIRKRVVEAENMSINARNVKIITEDGKVVLRGPVNSAAEKESIEKMARDVAGKDNVDSQIEVVENKP
jgi:hypothetical protein